MGRLSTLCNTDGQYILVARAVRTFGYGFLSVVLTLYMLRLGLDSFMIGLLLTTALIGSVLLTLGLTKLTEHWGRRKILQFCAGLMALSGFVFALSDNLWLLLAAALTGTISATSGEVGPFLSLEQAILPQTTTTNKRTRLFAVYNLVGSLAGAFGALFSGLTSWLVGLLLANQPSLNPTLIAERLLLLLYGLLAVSNILIFSRLSSQVEFEAQDKIIAKSLEPAVKTQDLDLEKTNKTVFTLALLFSLDAFGGGFVVQSVVVYWFSLKFNIGLEILGPIFFAANTLSAFSFLVAEKLAARIGLINTMVFTHLPSNVLLMLVPLMPDIWLAVLMLLARQALSQMDVPTRQSYTMAVVPPSQRLAAASITSVSRNLAQATSPLIAGYILQLAALGLPFLIAGSLKIIYDLSLWFTFHQLKPAEEQTASKLS